MKIEIGKRMSDNDHECMETQTIEKYKAKIFELEERNKELEATIRHLICRNMDDNCQALELQVANYKYQGQSTDTDRSPPDGQDIQDGSCEWSPSGGNGQEEKIFLNEKTNLKTESKDLEAEPNKLLDINK